MKKPEDGPLEVLRQVIDAAERARDLETALALLLRAAWNVMETGEPYVSEEQGLARMNALADLIGYPRPGGPPPKPRAPQQELQKAAETLGEHVEATIPNGWTFTLILYESKPGGQVAHMARDPEASREVMRRFLEEAGAPAPKARG